LVRHGLGRVHATDLLYTIALKKILIDNSKINLLTLNKKNMNRLMLKSLAVFVFVIAVGTVMAQDPWVSLGSKKVNFGLDRDVIHVSYRDNLLTAIKILVNDGALNMHKCTVYFENGGQQEVELRHNFAAGSNSRVIDLKGNKRNIDRIEFWYDTKNAANRKAEVQVWGRK